MGKLLSKDVLLQLVTCCSPILLGALEREWYHRAGCCIVWSLAEGSSGGLGHPVPVKGNDSDKAEQPTFRIWGWAGANKGPSNTVVGVVCSAALRSEFSYLPLITGSVPSLWGHTHLAMP